MFIGGEVCSLADSNFNRLESFENSRFEVIAQEGCCNLLSNCRMQEDLRESRGFAVFLRIEIVGNPVAFSGKLPEAIGTVDARSRHDESRAVDEMPNLGQEVLDLSPVERRVAWCAGVHVFIAQTRHGIRVNGYLSWR